MDAAGQSPELSYCLEQVVVSGIDQSHGGHVFIVAPRRPGVIAG
jgi:hypothetical protein